MKYIIGRVGPMALWMVIAAFVVPSVSLAQPLYLKPAGTTSALSSFENSNGLKGNGGKANRTAKGHAFETLAPGQSRDLLNYAGAGTIQRIWMTIDQTPMKLRSLRLQMFWDGARKPAVDVPFGDFFCYNLGKQVAFESALFSSGEGRSFNCYIPMPFRTAAKIRVINEGSEPIILFYDIDFIRATPEAGALYFHAFWNRQSTSAIGQDYTILPQITGNGRFLGVSAGLLLDSSYQQSWWGEGEVKMYLDHDSIYPSIVGTGAEDYIGSAYGLGKFINRYQGCTVADEPHGLISFYRFHIPDAIYFDQHLRVTIQQIGGWNRDNVRRLVSRGVKLTPVSVAATDSFYRLIEHPMDLSSPSFPDGWVNFYRADDYSSVAYFYLDRPVTELPVLAPLKQRIPKIIL